MEKFGGGFYGAKLEGGIFVFNGFFMTMRSAFVAPGASIHYYVVEWDPKDLKWSEFRGDLLGPTDPAQASLSFYFRMGKSLTSFFFITGAARVSSRGDLRGVEGARVAQRAVHGRERRARVRVAPRGPRGARQLAQGVRLQGRFR